MNDPVISCAFLSLFAARLYLECWKRGARGARIVLLRRRTCPPAWRGRWTDNRARGGNRRVGMGGAVGGSTSRETTGARPSSRSARSPADKDQCDSASATAKISSQAPGENTGDARSGRPDDDGNDSPSQRRRVGTTRRRAWLGCYFLPALAGFFFAAGFLATFLAVFLAGAVFFFVGIRKRESDWLDTLGARSGAEEVARMTADRLRTSGAGSTPRR